MILLGYIFYIYGAIHAAMAYHMESDMTLPPQLQIAAFIMILGYSFILYGQSIIL